MKIGDNVKLINVNPDVDFDQLVKIQKLQLVGEIESFTTEHAVVKFDHFTQIIHRGKLEVVYEKR